MFELRDWFAGKSGVSLVELWQAAGSPDHVAMESSMWRPPGTDEGRVALRDWWAGLPLAEMLALSAKVRFMEADAMLAERAK